MVANFGCKIKDSMQTGVLRCNKLLVFDGKIKDGHDDIINDRCKLVFNPHLIEIKKEIAEVSYEM
jgi:hypothetical protein